MSSKPENSCGQNDWPAIAARIRARDGDCCKACGIDNGTRGYRERDGAFREVECLHDLDVAAAAGRKVIKIVLACVQITPEVPAPTDDDFAALCQRCHTQFNLKQRQMKAVRTRTSRKASADLFGDRA